MNTVESGALDPIDRGCNHLKEGDMDLFVCRRATNVLGFLSCAAVTLCACHYLLCSCLFWVTSRMGYGKKAEFPLTGASPISAVGTNVGSCDREQR